MKAFNDLEEEDLDRNKFNTSTHQQQNFEGSFVQSQNRNAGPPSAQKGASALPPVGMAKDLSYEQNMDDIMNDAEKSKEEYKPQPIGAMHKELAENKAQLDHLNQQNHQERINFGAVIGDESNYGISQLETPKGPGDGSSRNFASKKESTADPVAVDTEKLKKYSEGPKFVVGKKKKKKKLNQSITAQEEAMLQKQIDAMNADQDDFGFTKIGGGEPEQNFAKDAFELPGEKKDNSKAEKDAMAGMFSDDDFNDFGLDSEKL